MKTKRPDERRIKRYMREDRKFDANAYRKAWYRTGEQLAKSKKVK